MSIRQIIGTLGLLCACVAWLPAAEAAGPKRPMAFAVTGDVECVVDFGPALPISAIAFGPDGKTLAVGGYQEVLLWDLEEAKLAKRIGSGHLTGLVHAVAFVRDGKALAVGDGVPHQSGAVRIFDVETGEPVATFDEPNRVVCCLAPSPDGELLVAGDADSAVHVWNLTTEKLAKTLESHKGWVLGAAFSADGKRLATAGADQTLQVWDVSSWEPIIRYDTPATVHGAALSPDGKTVVGAVGGTASLAAGGTVQWALRIARIDTDVQQAARRKPKPRAISTGTGMPLDIVWPAKGTHVFVACHDHTVRAYQGTTGKLSTTYSGHTDWVYCVASTPDGSKLASAGADGTVKLWDPGGGKPLATLVHLSPRTDEWLIVTRQGHFAASKAELVQWKTTGASTPPEELTGRYHDPEMVRKALAASTTPPSAFRRKGSASSRGNTRRPGKASNKK